MSLCEFLEVNAISTFINNSFYSYSRKLFVQGIISPFHSLIFPSLKENSSKRVDKISNSKLFSCINTIFAFQIPLINTDGFNYNFHPDDPNQVIFKNENYSLEELLQISYHKPYSRRPANNLIKILLSLSKVDLSCQKEVKDWLQNSLAILPLNPVNSRNNYLYNSSMAYLTLLLLIASYGEYPVWISSSIGSINDGYTKTKSPEFLVNQYMEVVLKNTKSLQRIVSNHISRSMDPIDLLLYYLVTIKYSYDYHADSSYNFLSGYKHLS